MIVKLITPNSIMLHRDFVKVIADGTHGNFCILPRHADYLAPLVPGILVLTDQDDNVRLFATGDGLLVKCGNNVLITVRQAIASDNLVQLQATVRSRFQSMDAKKMAGIAAMASLEANLVRRLLELPLEVVDG